MAAAEAAHQAAAHGFDLVPVVTLLGAAVIAAPLFKRLGLGSVLGYLAAGLAIGPFGLGIFSDPMSIVHVAELGVVLFLFIIGLEMQPSRLWAMRNEIFGLGFLQVGLAIAALTCVGLALGFPVAQSFVAGTGFVLTSTAVVMQMLQERREIQSPKGRKIVAILLFEDLAIVPLLALVAFLAPGGGEVTMTERLTGVAVGLGAIAGLVLAGRFLLNPMFRILAHAEAREVMTAAALLVVLGAALVLQLGGLSMAMGAFLAGVLLSESSFRHQLEADIEPFRGILLGLFFLGVGMALDLTVIAANWQLIAISVAAYMVLKLVVIYIVARMLKTNHADALERAVMMAQGGEFAFVLYAAATSVGIIDGEANAILTATIIVSMALTPLMMIIHDSMKPKAVESMDEVEEAASLSNNVLLIGFGRFGQIASQPLLAAGHSVSILETSTEMIRDASDFGFKVYYGDGARLDILHAAGAHHAKAIIIAIDDEKRSNAIAELVRHEFPQVPVLARALHREHAVELIKAGVEYQVRDTFESALLLGERALVVLGETPEEAERIKAEVRSRDGERLDIELCGGIYDDTARNMIHGNAPVPEKARWKRD